MTILLLLHFQPDSSKIVETEWNQYSQAATTFKKLVKLS